VDLQVRLDVTRRLVKSLAALAIPDSLRRQRWVPASPGGQHADRWRDGLKQQAKRNDQQGKACARGVDVGLEPGFLSHVISLALTWNRVSPDALRKKKHLDGDIGWSTEDRLRLASGWKLVLLGQQLSQRGPHPQRPMVRFGVGSHCADRIVLAWVAGHL